MADLGAAIWWLLGEHKCVFKLLLHANIHFGNQNRSYKMPVEIEEAFRAQLCQNLFWRADFQYPHQNNGKF